MAILGSLLGSVMSWCYSLVNNYGLAIILFTLLSKVILLPVSIWVQFNSIKMVKMQPTLNRIKIDNYGDKDTIADETQKLYKKNHYHAMASIIPLFIQIILLIGVVSVIYKPMTYILNVDKDIVTRFEEVAVENDDSINPESSSIQLSVSKQIQAGNTDNYYALSGEFDEKTISKTVEKVKALDMNFFGFDLSWIPSRDGGSSLMVPLIAGFSAWLLSFCQNKMNVLQAASSKMSNLSTMLVSVGISLYLGFFVPSGVALYWIASNLLTIIQQYLLNKAINPKKKVNWKDLEQTRKELDSLNTSAKKRKKWNDPLNKRCKEDYKKFNALGNKHLVFYSESNGFYKYYAATIKWLLENTNIPIHYITSDPNDNIFEMAKENEQIKPYYIDSQKLITLMMKMDADVVVMTMPDLEQYQIKRSYVRKDVEYIYVPHAINSLNLVMRNGSMDYFDVILSVGKHQTEECEATQRVHHIENQTIIEAGYPLLDDLYNDYQKMLEKKEQESGAEIAEEDMQSTTDEVEKPTEFEETKVKENAVEENSEEATAAIVEEAEAVNEAETEESIKTVEENTEDNKSEETIVLSEEVSEPVVKEDYSDIFEKEDDISNTNTIETIDDIEQTSDEVSSNEEAETVTEEVEESIIDSQDVESKEESKEASIENIEEDAEEVVFVENKKTVLIAPSWQKDNIVDSCLEEMLDSLKDKDFNIIVRPHPQHVRHMPEKMEYLKEKYKDNKNITIQTDFSSNETIYMSDALITDWSSIAFEFAFATLKPVLFIDTPMKIMNPEYEEIGIPPFNIWIREKIGGVVDLDDIDTVGDKVQELLDNPTKYHDIIEDYRKEYVYNFTTSGQVSGEFIAHEVLKKIAIRKQEEEDA